ncbi:hypothetical protein CONPUDRAFT_125441 [Coniophora puteana RWD-64-598 SS2]|uniref:Actin-like ATPase domain-containing protein n=1 Tax=Coniophora puteana (strain RWD-64-598) TaxID=741705 RepID=A0A5M3MPH8_CONPW|nr:uncharacterized protein CONPUDRAFT_125441 [Coniophora puteana RWD-64-598 SS2]EIW80615.1 hypothetical protein CONPUDRAFT_125441 [Coniophora puteana RWD-64-598 SS2]
MLDRQPYKGLSRKLVLAFDVGTTFSGVSYCILDPGEVPKIQGVSRYPAQEQVGGDSKIPSILYYDRNQQARAIGAEALQENIIEKAEEEGWTKVEWWKMHLRSKHLNSSHIKDSDIPPLPAGVSALQVLADFMAYLYHCARTYITESHATGRDFLASFSDSIDFVLSHPNGWEGSQQTQIRRAAVIAGLVPDDKAGEERIQLVTEGEASLHYCVSNVLSSDKLARVPIEKPVDDDESSGAGASMRGGVIIVDAGGGTIDLSAYSMESATGTGKGMSFEEVAPTECRLQGSVFVTRRANTFLQEKLQGSRFAERDYIDQMTSIFDKTTKLRFRNADEPCYIKFGTMRDKEPSFDIRSGQLKLQGSDVAGLFQPAIESVVEAIQKQRQASTKEISFVFLVGGFAASDYLFSQLQSRLAPTGVTLSRPDSHTNKAVADGAASFYIDHLVSSRAARFAYGVECFTVFEPYNSEHIKRQHTKCVAASGVVAVPHFFTSIVRKGTRVAEIQEFKHPYRKQDNELEGCKQIEGHILAYRGSDADPRWTDDDNASFTRLCTVRADTSELAKSLRPRTAPGRTYYELEFEVVLLFGLTELRAQISWRDSSGAQQRSPAVVVYDDAM